MPERPQTPSSDAAADSAQSDGTAAQRADEPETKGTVFLTLILLMMIFGFWVMMYVMLIEQ